MVTGQKHSDVSANFKYIGYTADQLAQIHQEMILWHDS